MKKLIIIAIFLVSGALANNSISNPVAPIICGDFGTGMTVCCSTYMEGDCIWEGEIYDNPIYFPTP